jgi:two-component SAPR family response regulator
MSSAILSPRAADFGFGDTDLRSALMPWAATESAVPRVVLLDDDRIFAKTMERIAKKNAISLMSICNPEDLERIAGMDFDLALVDFDLGDVTGVELAEGVSEAVGYIPIIMISNRRRRPTAGEPWPATIKRFVEKSVGPAEILDQALDVYHHKLWGRPS